MGDKINLQSLGNAGYTSQKYALIEKIHREDDDDNDFGGYSYGGFCYS